MDNHVIWRCKYKRLFDNGAAHQTAIKEVGSLKMQRKEALSDYDPAFSNLDKITLPTDAFDWGRLFNDPKAGRYNAVYARS